MLPGSRITVILASQSVTVAVPDVRLQTEAQLFALLAQMELLPGIRSEEFDATVPATLLTRTSPRAGIQVARGTAIDYLVSLGAPPTPFTARSRSLLLQSSRRHRLQLRRLLRHLRPLRLQPRLPTPTAPPTPTLQPTPAPTPVTVGNYATCASLGEARTQIEAADLVVGEVFAGSTGDVDDSWQVAQQFPESGEQVQPGTQVDLLVKSPTGDCP